MTYREQAVGRFMRLIENNACVEEGGYAQKRHVPNYV